MAVKANNTPNTKKLSIPCFTSFLIAAGVLVISTTIVLAADTDTGVKYPGTVATNSEAPYDDENWTSPGNISADGGGDAKITTNNFDNNDYSYVLRAINFDFSAIPADSTIQGIKVEIERKSDSDERGKDAVVQLTKDGTARVGDNKADTSTEWPTSMGVKTYGGPTDLWGTTWVPDEIKASTFGVHLAAQATDNDADIYVDFIRITVYYNAPQRTITASAGTGGTITPSGAVMVNNGVSQAFAVVPNATYIVADVLIDAASQGKPNSYTFNNVTVDHTISASFDDGWSAPTTGTSVSNNESAINQNNAFTSNDSYAVFNSSNDTADYGNFGLSVPTGATINGIEVALEGNRDSSREFDISLSWDGGTSFTTGAGTGVKNSGDFPSAADFTLIEGGPSDTWGAAHAWAPGDFTNPNFKVRLDAGSESGSGDVINLDQIQVKVHYTIPPGHIVVDKITNPPGDPQSFDFDAAGGAYADFGLTDTDAPNDQTLAPGSYSVFETVPVGWAQSNAVCVSSIGDFEIIDTIELDSGETVTCVFTNTKQATLTVHKVVVPAIDIGKFNLQIDGSTAGTGANVGDGGTTGAVFVAPEIEHTVEETAGSGTNLADYASVVGGDCDTQGHITLSPGDSKTCTITNTKLGSITVIKNAIPNDLQDFSFTTTGNGLSDFTLDDDSDGTLSNTKVFGNLAAGSYSVTETNPPDNWDNTGATCDDADTPATETGDPSSITLGAGQNLVCTFTNTKHAEFHLEKISNPDPQPNPNDGSLSFQFTLDGPNSYYNSTTFSPSGVWDFPNVISGDYSLLETVLSPSGWSGSQVIACNGDGSNDPSGTVASPFPFTLNPGESMSCIVNNTQDALITGKKFEDVNADGIAGEDSGLSDWTITATKIVADDPDTPDVDESLNPPTYTDTTDDGGDYTLRVPPGIYKICETLQNGWTQSYPTGSAANSTSCGDGYGYEWTVAAGDNKNGNDFGNYEKGSISGYKWEDRDADGELDTGGELDENNENLLDEWTIFLDLNDNGIFDDNEPYQETGDEEEGYYSFGNLTPGTYIVREALESGWTQTFPGIGTSFKHTVTVVSGENEEDWNFGNFKLADVTGFKWDDRNGNGIRDFNDANGNQTKDADEEYTESGLPDVTVALGRQNGEPRQENGHETVPIEIIAMSLTGADGGFTIRGIGPGRYKLFEENKSGWQTTNPAPRIDSFFDITYRIDLPETPSKPQSLVQDSFFDVFVELSGQNVSQSEATLVTTVPSVPLEFGNHQPLVINKETMAAIEVGQISTIINWTTDRPGTSRVVYDIISHPVLGSAPNYGYANSTATFDENPNQTTNHSVTVNGLTAGTSYYYRTISAASPETVSDEGIVTTSTSSPAPSNNNESSGGGGGGGWTPPSPTEPEGGFKFSINPDVTTTGIVTLHFDGGPDAEKIAIADNPNFALATYINYSVSTAWTLSGAPGEKTLYAKFSNQYGQYSKVVSDTVVYARPEPAEELPEIAIPETEQPELSQETLVIVETDNRRVTPNESAVIPEPASAPQPIAPQSLLAAVGSIITFGTDRAIVGLLVTAIILAFLGYVLYKSRL